MCTKFTSFTSHTWAEIPTRQGLGEAPGGSGGTLGGEARGASLGLPSPRLRLFPLCDSLSLTPKYFKGELPWVSRFLHENKT